MRWGSSAPHRAPESVTENLGSIRLVNAVVPVLGDLLAPLTVLPCIPPQGHDWDDSSLRGGEIHKQFHIWETPIVRPKFFP